MTRDEVMNCCQVLDSTSSERLRKWDATQRATIEALQTRLRVTAQLGIESVGASGPEDVESVVGRMVAKIERQAKEIERLQLKVNEWMRRNDRIERELRGYRTREQEVEKLKQQQAEVGNDDF